MIMNLGSAHVRPCTGYIHVHAEKRSKPWLIYTPSVWLCLFLGFWNLWMCFLVIRGLNFLWCLQTLVKTDKIYTRKEFIVTIYIQIYVRYMYTQCIYNKIHFFFFCPGNIARHGIDINANCCKEVTCKIYLSITFKECITM